MKTNIRKTICVLIAALMVTAGFAFAGGADRPVPFKGTFQGTDADTCFNFPIACVDTQGTGISTVIGQFTFTMNNHVNVTNGTDYGTVTLTAANGDTITTTYVGSGETVGPNLFSITEVHTITGGTGRFADAQGSFTVERMASGTTFLTSGSIHGTITAPGVSHEHTLIFLAGE